ncbi:V-set and immunoglobulin domain-containing protein 2 [Balaenoptera musculus]|uniref:V-set and immunoglobulin domain-containing protein 2 n=1 Tax=Balaenoptera musculus TaxID=9771 RepID=UPI001874F8A9|nr:V-set and immunoglobulin domain-containing protein 2 [Balaenoptera musculus]
MAWLPGPFLCGALLGWVCLSGQRRPAGQQTSWASREGLTTTRLLFSFPRQAHPQTRPSLGPFRSFHPKKPVVCGLLPPGNLRFQEGRDGAEGAEPQGRRAPRPGHLSASPAGLSATPAPGLAVEVKVPTEPLSAPVGKTAELTCSYSTSVGDNFALEWSFVQPGRPVSSSQPILYFTNGQLYPTGSKAERASLLQNPPTGGVATLKLTDVHPSDTGTYLCHVNNPPDFYTNGLGLINLTVLVPPNSPSCSQSGQTSVGGSAALRCSSSEGAPRPVYNWIRLGSSPTPPPGSMVQDEVSGRLILTNLSLVSSGTYRCVATNQMGSASCELTLSVTDPSKGRVAGAVIGVLLGVLFLSVAVFCLIRFQKDRRKKPKETYRGSDLREDATAPGIYEQTSVRADSNNGLLERPPSASTVTTAKSKLPMVV